MSKKIAFDLQLPNGEIKNVMLQGPQLRAFPDFFIDLFNFLTNITTTLFFLIIFIAHVFNFSSVVEVDFVILVYTYVILMAFFQFCKLILGGDKFFPKVGYDLFVLLLPPFVIIPLVLSDNLNLGMFGTLQTWNSTGITILSMIIYSYILAVNFSYKRAFKNIQFCFEVGLVIAAITRFINPNLVVPDVDILLALLIPVYVYRIFKVDSLRLKFTAVLLSTFGILITIGNNFANNNLVNFTWGFEHVVFVLNALLLGFGVASLMRNRKNILKSIAKTTKNGAVQITIPKGFNLKNWSFIGKFVAFAYFVISTIWMANTGFLGDILSTFATGIKNVFATGNFQSLLVGTGVSLEGNYFLVLIDSFGLVAAIAIFLSLFVILYKEVTKLGKKVDPVNFSIILGEIIFLVVAIFMQLSTVLVFAQFTFLSFIMISARSGEYDFEQFEYFSLKGIKNKALRIVLNIIKVAVIILSFAGVMLVIASLTSIIGRNLR